MRFLVKLETASGKEAKIDIDYRRRFISFLKKVFGPEYFSVDSTKPYTFAVYFGKNSKFKDGFIHNVSKINFRFSTGDMDTAIKFYNGILKLKKVDFNQKIGTEGFRISWIKEEKEKRPNGYFKVLSPVVIERIGFENSKDPEDRYITPEEPGFEESVMENLIRRYEMIKGESFKVKNFKFVPIRVRKEFVKHYGGLIKCFIGKFYIDTDSNELLDFIYKYGLGLRTGQGFGYLEVEDEKA